MTEIDHEVFREKLDPESDAIKDLIPEFRSKNVAEQFSSHTTKAFTSRNLQAKSNTDKGNYRY